MQIKKYNMKKIFPILSFAIVVSLSFNSIYDYSFTTIEGDTKTLGNYRQKKIVIITLPINETTETTRYLQRLDSLSKAHSSQLIMIGVPSFEDGYSASKKNTLKSWYRSKIGSQVIIAQGMYTRKVSGGQNQIFKWLTDKDLNTHFDIDVNGYGHQFFISETGELYGNIISEAKWSNRIFRELVH